MDSLVKPLEKVVEAAEWFVRTPALRVLHVVTSGLMRAPVLRHLTATELLEVNTCPFFVLEAPTEADDDGWALRTEELRADWEGLRDGAPNPEEVAPLWPAHAEGLPLARFVLELGRGLGAVRPPMTGLVIVLAPVWVRDVPRWRSDLSTLLQLKQLSSARFVIVETEQPFSLPVIETLGPLAEHVDARIDDAQMRADAAAKVAAMRDAPPGATGYQLIGAAGPSVSPPPRTNQPPPLSPGQQQQLAQEAGVSPVMFQPDVMKELRVLILSAAGAMSEGDPPEAVRLQREARDFCARHGLIRETVVNELVLAGYVVQAGQSERALQIFGDARKRAEEAKLIEMAVQAQLAIGACLLVLKRTDDAAAAYAEAGQLGATAGAPILGIEAYRMCGQLLVSKGRLQEATLAFRRALGTAEAAGPEVQRNSTAPQAARALAAVCRKHGLEQQAESLDAQAAAMEQPAEAAASLDDPAQPHAEGG